MPEEVDRNWLGRESLDPYEFSPLHAWVLVKQDDDPVATPGGIIIPDNSKTRGRKIASGEVIAVGGGRGKDCLWDMPSPGSRIAFSVIANFPDTQQAIQSRFGVRDGNIKYFLVHGMDVLLEWDNDLELRVR